MTPQNVGIDTCDACKVRRRVLALGSAKQCSSCTRKLVAGWAILCGMYEPVAREVLAEAHASLTEGASE